jgi:Fic family protein
MESGMTSQEATIIPHKSYRLRKSAQLHSLYGTRAKSLLVLTCKDECPITMNQLVEMTQLPYLTVHRIVTELASLEILHEIPQAGREKLWGFNKVKFKSRGRIS